MSKPFKLSSSPTNPDQAPGWLSDAIAWAREYNATDLHFFPSREEPYLCARVDGVLCEVARYAPDIHERLIARLKVMGRCTAYEGELIQEGRFSLNGSNAPQGEARLSIVPTLTGEKAVLRLLTQNNTLQDLASLGYPEELCLMLQKAMDAPQGLLLAVGPSGCGKSTTLYALLRDLTKRTHHPLSMVTIEDPVEQHLECAAQVTIDKAHGFQFAHAVRAILRQDPEVVMIGEIRDAETAEAALQAALTGHRLLSSMHTLSAAEALIRLRQMGSPAYVVSSAVQGILNVRLIRLLCSSCRESRTISKSEQEVLPESNGWPQSRLAQPKGCDKCMNSGYQGRTGIAEWSLPTPATAEVLSAERPTKELEQTLQTAYHARQTALRHLQEQRINLADWQGLSGFASQR